MNTPFDTDHEYKRGIRAGIDTVIREGIVLSQWEDEQAALSSSITDLLLDSAVIREVQARAWEQGYLAMNADRIYGTGTENPYEGEGTK